MKTRNQDKLVEALKRLLEDKQPVELVMDKASCWSLICTIQLACRHPRFTGPTRDKVEKIARDIGTELTSNDPDLRMLFDMGWCKQFDS